MFIIVLMIDYLEYQELGLIHEEVKIRISNFFEKKSNFWVSML